MKGFVGKNRDWGDEPDIRGLFSDQRTEVFSFKSVCIKGFLEKHLRNRTSH